ncbi:MAG TPA: hypothetical protein DCL36_05845 [Vibrio sp.]|nr:DUF3273 domain-containing protein [Vibrio sp. SBT000027]HAH02510.1 hypothetical protein [Vibrio sp.]HAS25121.1 hypothetical protein [Vibrio sp.]
MFNNLGFIQSSTFYDAVAMIFYGHAFYLCDVYHDDHQNGD